MVFLAVICGGVIALQKWQFSIVRLAAGVGVIILCTLCLVDPDSVVVRYNAERYLAGTLSSFDVNILYRAGSAGVEPALEVYTKTNDQVLKAQLQPYFFQQKQHTQNSFGKPGDNLQNARARQKIAEYAALSQAE
jgi:hypothetical protein